MKKILSVFLFICIIRILLASPSLAQDISATARLETNSIIVGQPIRLSFRVIVPKGQGVRFPYLKANLEEFLEIIDEQAVDSLPLNDKLHIIRKQYLLLSFEAGVHTIPSYNFFVLNDNGKVIDTLRSDSMMVEVKTMQIDTAQDIKAIKPPFNTPFIFQEVIPLLLTILFCSIITTIIIYLYIKTRKARQQRPVVIPVAVPDPADKVAIKELGKLKSEKLLEQNKIKEYHSRLSDIIRNYIEDQRQIPAMESTTDQLLKEFNSEKELKHLLYEILTVGDLVKYAKHTPDIKESESIYNTAVKFVSKTKSDLVQEDQTK